MRRARQLFFLVVLLLAFAATPLFAAETKTEEKVAETDSRGLLELVTSGSGLLLVGGGGYLISAFNKSREKENAPAKEIDVSEDLPKGTKKLD